MLLKEVKKVSNLIFIYLFHLTYCFKKKFELKHVRTVQNFCLAKFDVFEYPELQNSNRFKSKIAKRLLKSSKS